MKQNMKIASMLAMTAAAFLLAAEPVSAQTADSTAAAHGPGFIDADGDGVNDRARDDDGDGIPNGRDPDFDRQGRGGRGQGFIDADGDGINDMRQDADGDGIVNGMDSDYLRGGRGPAGRGMGFVDTNADGINDLIQDSDGDGIRNCQDPDWTRPEAPGRKGGRGGQGKGK